MLNTLAACAEGWGEEAVGTCGCSFLIAPQKNRKQRKIGNSAIEL